MVRATSFCRMSNHLTYCCDSVEGVAETPVARARYLLPGLVYEPEQSAEVAPTPGRTVVAPAARAVEGRERRPSTTWQARAGRESGGEGYQFGDVTRMFSRWVQQKVDGEGEP